MCNIVWDEDKKHLFIESEDGERKRLDKEIISMHSSMRRSERNYAEEMRLEIAKILGTLRMDANS